MLTETQLYVIWSDIIDTDDKLKLDLLIATSPWLW